MNDLREDGFLDGRLRIFQPTRGYRSGADAVMLAAACAARSEDTVLELGCGAGVASLCLAWRVRSQHVTGLEKQPEYAELARRNAVHNHLNLHVITGDLGDMPSELRGMSFDHVMANPPYFLSGTAAYDDGRSAARQEATPLAIWIDAALRRLRPGGTITLIQRADRLGGILAALDGRAGSIVILPVAARMGRDSGRIIVAARKGSKGALRLAAPFVMHEAPRHERDQEDLSPRAQAVLRDGKVITEFFTKLS